MVVVLAGPVAGAAGSNVVKQYPTQVHVRLLQSLDGLFDLSHRVFARLQHHQRPAGRLAYDRRIGYRQNGRRIDDDVIVSRTERVQEIAEPLVEQQLYRIRGRRSGWHHGEVTHRRRVQGVTDGDLAADEVG